MEVKRESQARRDAEGKTKVSILVLMEVKREVIVVATRLAAVALVSILVLMEVKRELTASI